MSNDNPGKRWKAIEWALTVDPSECRKYVADKRKAHPDEPSRRIAERIASVYVRKATLEGFITGLPGNPLLAFGGAIGDVAVMLRFYAWLTAVVGYTHDEKYFDDPDWKIDAILMLLGPKAASRLLRELGIQGGRQTTKVVIRKYISKDLLKWLKKMILKWFGKKVTQRAIIAKALPILGGVIGGLWNYAEIKIVGKRIIRYHFEDVFGAGD